MRFETGDHLRVRRSPLGYFHHGIYVSDERVIQFGGRVCDKPHATIEAVSLPAFERNSIAEVVHHGGHTWFGAWRPEVEPRQKIVQRAEWLLATHPEGLYDLVGYNCEHAANFCASGWPESYQVRGYFAVRALAGGGPRPVRHQAGAMVGAVGDGRRRLVALRDRDRSLLLGASSAARNRHARMAEAIGCVSRSPSLSSDK